MAEKSDADIFSGIIYCILYNNNLQSPAPYTELFFPKFFYMLGVIYSLSSSNYGKQTV